MDNRQHLTEKTKKAPFLGTLDYERKVIKKSNDLVCITLESQYRNSGLMSVIFAFVLWFLTWRAYPHSKLFGNIFLIFVSIVFSLAGILFLAYKKRLYWETDKNQIHFLWGFYPFVKTESLDLTELKVQTETCHKSKREQINLSNSADLKIAILQSKNPKVISAVFKELHNFLKQIKDISKGHQAAEKV